MHDTMLFKEAAALWLAHKSARVEPGTLSAYMDYLKRLSSTFDERPLNTITIDDLREYQNRWRTKYHPTSVNHDLNTLSQVLKHLDAWPESLARHYQPLTAPRWQPPKVLTEKQKQDFFTFAASSKKWEIAYLVAKITANTSASGKELRLLRLEHLHLGDNPPTFDVPIGKNKYRQRRIPLNTDAAEAFRRLLGYTYRRGSSAPQHYVFPYRDHRTRRYNPDRPAAQSWIYRQWNHLLEAALESKIIPFRITPHCLRHQCITELLEKGVPEQTVMSVAGHVSRQMMAHYSHTRISAKAEAVNVLGKPGTFTPSGSTPAPAVLPLPDVSGEMLQAARLVKECGIDVSTAVSIVRQMSQGGSHA